MLAQESLDLLEAALWDDQFSDLFQLEVYGSILGMFELNNMGIQVPSILEAAINDTAHATAAADNEEAGELLLDILSFGN